MENSFPLLFLDFRCWFIITAYQNVACLFKKHSHHLRAILNIKCQGRFISSWGLEHSQFTALKICSLQLAIRGCILEGDGLKSDIKKLWLSIWNQGDSKQEDWRSRIQAREDNFKEHNIAAACRKIAIAAHRPTLAYQELKRLFFFFFKQKCLQSLRSNVTHKKSSALSVMQTDKQIKTHCGNDPSLTNYIIK